MIRSFRIRKRKNYQDRCFRNSSIFSVACLLVTSQMKFLATIFNKICQKMLKGVGRVPASFMVKCVKNESKGEKSMKIKTDVKAKRRPFMDNIRWITVFIVVVYHVIYMFNGVQPYGVIGPFQKLQYQDAFQYLVYPWFMALLFVISGMSARYCLETHNTREFVRSRTRKLLVPSTVGLFVFQWILGYYNMRIGGAFDPLPAVPFPVLYGIMAVSGIGVLWYIQVLWIFSMLLLVVRKLEKERLWNLGAKPPVWMLALFVIFAYGSAQILNTPVITVYRFGIYGFCFFMGYFVFSHDEVVERLSKWWWIFAIAAALIGIFYAVHYFGENYAVAPVLNNIPACVYCWFAVLAIIAFMKKYGNQSNPVSKWMAKKSWGLYVFHYLPLAMTAYYLHQYFPELPALLVYLLVGISSVAGALLLNEVISRIPGIRWCVLGIKKEKKHV